MPDIRISDQLDKPVDSIKVDLSHPSSLLKYLRSEALHLAVVPDFLERKEKKLSEVATKPIQFRASVSNQFQLGTTNPEVTVQPEGKVTLRVNATSGSGVFEDDPFHGTAKVPNDIGYFGVQLQGKLVLGVNGSQGNLTFGFDKDSEISFDFRKAFPLGVNDEVTLGSALGHTLSAFVIPAAISDLELLHVGDIATVSGKGSLHVSGGVTVTASPNPLASVDLPFSAGTVALKAGASVGLSASFTLDGTYQIRTRRKDADTVELSILRAQGSTFAASFSGSAGVTAMFGDKDLIAEILGAISTDPIADKKLLAELRSEERDTFTDAIKKGLDHSVHASVIETLDALAADQAAFQYEIKPAELREDARVAVQKALTGDFGLLTAMEGGTKEDDGVLAPGVKMLNSVLTETRKRTTVFKLNLIGILNCLSVGKLIQNCEILTDSVSGDVTIKETVTGQRISAIIEPMARNEALRKAMFDSFLVTTTYRAGRALPFPDMASEHMHFALNQNTNQQIMADYLRWLTALNLLTNEDQERYLHSFNDGGASSCLLRTTLSEYDCTSMFLDGENPRTTAYYLELGRRALRALLDPDRQAIDKLRYRILADEIWPSALRNGANPTLGTLVGLSTDDVRVNYLIGDVVVITDWADAMASVGKIVQEMRKLVGDSNPATLLGNAWFEQERQALQKKLSAVVRTSKTRFEEPWGMVTLFWAAGSPRSAYGKIATEHLDVERRSQPMTLRVGE